MAGEELINRIADRNAVKEDYDYVVGLVESIDKMIQDVNRRLTSMGKGAPASSSDQRAQTDELAQSNKKLLDVQAALARETERRAEAERRMSEGLTASQAATREQTTLLRNQAVAVSELATPYARLAAQVAVAQSAAKNAGAAVIELTQQFGENSAQVRAAQAEYDKLKTKGLELTESIKRLEAAVGDNRRNVGNYVGAVQSLRPALDEVRGKLNQLTQAGEQSSKEFNELSRVEQHLAQVVGQQAEGYASLTAEIRATEKVLADMYAAGLQGTEAFVQMDQEVRKLHTDLNEFHKRQQLLENDTPVLTTLAFAARGLGGAYAAAMGASALFADGNEKVEKELNKLVAVMTFLQGLMETTELLKQSDAVLTALQASQEKAYTGWLALKNYWLNGTAAAQAASNEVTAASVPVAEAATAATEGQAVANEGLAVAEGTATAGAIALRVALTAVGIGAVIALVIGIVEAFKAWTSSTMDEVAALKELSEAQMKVIEANRTYRESLNAGGDKQLDMLKNQLSVMQAQGRSQYEILAAQQQIAQHQAITAQPDAQENSRSVQLNRKNDMDQHALEYRHATQLMEDADQHYADTGEESWKRTRDMWKDIADAQKAAFDSIKAEYDDGVKANQEYNDAIQKQAEIAAEVQRLHQQELTAYTLLQAKNRAQGIIDQSAKIEANEKSTQAERIAALKASAAAQRQIAASERTAILADPGTTTTPGGGVDQANATYKAQRVKIALDLATSIEKVNNDFRLRDLQAVYETEKAKLDFISATEEKISQDNRKGLNERLAAYAAYVHAQKALIELDYNNQIQKTPLLTTAQRGALDEQKQDKTTGVDIKSVTDVTGIAKDALDQQFKNTSGAADTSGINAEIAAYQKLNDQLKAGTIDLKTYNQEKAKLENSAATKALQVQTDLLEKLSADYKKNGIDTTEIDKQIAENKLAMIKKVGDAQEAAAAKQKATEQEGAKLTQTLVSKTTDLIFSLADDSIERQKNALQKQQDQQEKAADAQIAAVSRMNLSDQDRAARIKIIQAEEQIQKEANAREQRKLDQEKAKFDKAASIAKIIEATAVAATEALSYGPISGEIFAALVIAAGAVELAKVAATPIPAYAGGTGVSGTPTAGVARVSERGAELGILPTGDKFMTPSRESLMYLPKGTRIIPHDEVAEHLNGSYAVDMRTLAGYPDPGGQQIERLTGAVNKQTQELVKALGALEVKGGDVHVHLNPDWNFYLSKNL